jgi:hydroxyacyl-ACP dehydratase HTD2-like protein with hotdog domain
MPEEGARYDMEEQLDSPCILRYSALKISSWLAHFNLRYATTAKFSN